MPEFYSEPMYSLCDLSIVPAVKSNIESRSECNVYYDHDRLPIFASPMDSVVDEKNYQIFNDNHITPIIHRNVRLNERTRLTKSGLWCAYRLSEFEEIFCNEDSDIYNDAEIYFNENGETTEIYALIDVANGHMTKIFELAKKAKKTAQSRNVYLCLMAGNIANPETYNIYCESGIDYVRCSIGTGSMCLTSANTAVGYGNASLLMEIAKIRHDYVLRQRTLDIKDEDIFLTKVIADGGIRNFSDAIIALACGADYVMIGGLFAKFIDSCAKFNTEKLEIYNLKNFETGFCSNYDEETGQYTFILPKTIENESGEPVLTVDEYESLYYRYDLSCYPETILVDDYHWVVSIKLTLSEIQRYEEVKRFLLKYVKLSKSSHGMSSKEAQIGGVLMQGEKVDKTKLKTSEGKTITGNVEYSCQKWTENFERFLKSAMSYTNHKYIEDFVGNVKLRIRSYGTALSVNK